MNLDDLYINRCFQLALKGIGSTRTNPLVGAVLVYKNKIIGEGYHAEFGAAHAEIQAFNSVRDEDQVYISKSTLYVNLEPCCIHGKTPPCVDEIIRRKIKRVIIGQLDPNPKINGAGIKIMQKKGIEVIMSTLEPEARKLNKVFQKNMTIGLPYITLKFACSADGFIGRADQRIKISNSWSEYIVHKIRHQVDGILIGTNTALIDNPSLTNRLYFGKSPVRIVMDRMGIIPMHYNIFADGGNTWLITENAKNQYGPNVKLLPWNPDLTQLLKDLLNLGLSSILVEGGAKTLDSFIKAKLWDELWCTQSKTTLHYGISAPLISGNIGWSTQIGSDDLRIYYNDEQNR